MATKWRVESRKYLFERWEHGVAQRIRAEREDGAAWTRVLETVYWWPTHEGKEWPATVVPVPEWSGVGEEPDAWAHFEEALGIDERYRWEALESD